MMYSQINCINQEREAWLANQTALLTEVRELQRLHRETVAGAYETFLDKERTYWLQQREDWERKEAALLAQVASLRAGLQHPGTASSTSASAAQPGGGLAPGSASTQVADLLRQVAPAGSTAGQQAPAAPPTPRAPVRQAAATTPATPENMPGFAADLAAAIAAVEHVDVLQDNQLSRFMTRHAAAAPPSAPTPAAPPTPAASSQPAAPGTPDAKDRKGGPWAGAGAVVEPAGQQRRAAVEATPIEVVMAPQNGPPPMLRWGDNDIYWMGRLHAGLASHGFYSSDEEEADYVFGDSTQEAVAYFQASVGLPETGVATTETWEKLLQGTPEEFPLIGGSAPHKEAPPSPPAGGGTSSWHEDEDEAAWGRAGAKAAAAASEARKEGSAGAGLGTNGTGKAAGSGSKEEEKGRVGGNGSAAAVGAAATLASSSSSGSGSSSNGSSSSHSGTSSGRVASNKEPRTVWPVVRDQDGGWEVHALQALLSQKGYRCSDDERQWWQCGSSTIEALLYFQACEGLPESGVCAEQTWRLLLATPEDPEGATAAPSDIDAVGSDDEFCEDMSVHGGTAGGGRVYLLGEDRWSTT